MSFAIVQNHVVLDENCVEDIYQAILPEYGFFEEETDAWDRIRVIIETFDPLGYDIPVPELEVIEVNDSPIRS